MQNRLSGLGRKALAWLRRHDPDLAATRRAGRCAIVSSALFALGMQVLNSSALAYYAAFGCFSMLLFVDFTGPMVQRLRAQLELGVAWALLVTLGTLAARVTWVAVVATLAVSFLILFSGVVSSVLASASTALLLAFVIPVSSPVPYGQLPGRLAGVGLAAGGSMLAIWLLWPRASADPLSAPAARVCRTAAARLRSEVRALSHDSEKPRAEPTASSAIEAVAAAKALRRAFDRTPYRPTGLSVGSRALVRLVDELTWLSAVAESASLRRGPATSDDPAADAVRSAIADLLDLCADLLSADPRAGIEALRVQTRALRAAMDSLVEASAARLPSAVRTAGEGGDAEAYLGTLDVAFRVKELGFAALQVAANVELVAEAEQRSWFERLLGREPGALGGPATAARERARTHLHSNSVWLHNSLRGAVGLSISVALANVTSVQHSFWVLLGTLSVLRSNALNTGQNVLRAVGGTVVGSIIGAALLQGIGHQTEVLWFVLPLAVFIVGVAPAAISFAAGQAAFTVALVVIFSIGQNPDWHIALLRIQDIALGCAVSLLVALFFWPRGAAAAIEKALAKAYEDSATYLASAVAYGISRYGEGGGHRVPPTQVEGQAAAAARRLDDAFRYYLAERGAKPVTLASMTTLVTGVVRLRLAADAVLALWRRAGAARLDGAGAGARLELLAATDAVVDWYRGLAGGIAGHTPVRDPIGHSSASDVRLVESVQRDLRNEKGEATANAVRLIWTGDYVESARRLQPSLAEAAATARYQFFFEG